MVNSLKKTIVLAFATALLAASAMATAAYADGAKVGQGGPQVHDWTVWNSLDGGPKGETKHLNKNNPDGWSKDRCGWGDSQRTWVLERSNGKSRYGRQCPD